MPTGGIVGQCSLLAGHFGRGPRPKLFPLAEHAVRNRLLLLLLRNQEPLEINDDQTPLPATFSLLFTLAGAGVTEPSSKSVSRGQSRPRDRGVCEVRFCAISFGGVCGTGEKKVNLLEAPLPVSSDEASKSSR